MLDTTNGLLQGKYNWTASPDLALKFQGQLASPAMAAGSFGTNPNATSMFQAEVDYQSPNGTSLNAKSINADLLRTRKHGLTGIWTASLFQSVSKSVAVGAELVFQRIAMNAPAGRRGSYYLSDLGLTLAARWIQSPTDTLSVTWQPAMRSMQASYWHRVSEKVELGSELQISAGNGGGKREGPDAVTTIGAKFDFRQALIRASLSSAGTVAMVYEERLFPGFSLLFSGEIDQLAQWRAGGSAAANSRWGIGISLEN